MSCLVISGTNTRDHRVLPGGLVRLGPTERTLPMAAAHRNLRCIYLCRQMPAKSEDLTVRPSVRSGQVLCPVSWPGAPIASAAPRRSGLKCRLEPCWAEVTVSDHGRRWWFAAEMGGVTSALSMPSPSWGSHMPWLAGARPPPSPSKTSMWLPGRWNPQRKPRGEWLHLPSSCPWQPHGCWLRCCVASWDEPSVPSAGSMLVGRAQPWEQLQAGHHPAWGLRRADHPAVSPSQCRRSIPFTTGPPNPLVLCAPLLRHVATFTACLLIQTTMVIVLPIDWQQNHGKGSLTHVTRCYDPKIIRGKNLWEGSAESAWRTTRLLWDFKIN